MRLAPVLSAIALLTFTAPSAAQAPASAELAAQPEATQGALIEWLQRDCFEGLTQAEVSGLRGLRGNLESALQEAYRQGPPADLVERLRATFAADYDTRMATLEREGARLFSAEDVARLRAVDRQTYVQRRLDQTLLNYRTNAVLGLGVVDAEASRSLLNRIATDRGSPLAEAARTALGFIRDGVPLQPPE